MTDIAAIERVASRMFGVGLVLKGREVRDMCALLKCYHETNLDLMRQLDGMKSQLVEQQKGTAKVLEFINRTHRLDASGPREAILEAIAARRQR